DTRERALNVLLNNQEAQGRYDPGLLADLLDELEDLPEMELTGFDRSALPALRLDPVPDPAPLGDIDRVTGTLEMRNAPFNQIGPRLDELVTEFDLTSHVRRG